MGHMDKLLLIDKPAGITSFDVIRILRRKLGIKKLGHAGTLDPMATGLLLVGVGEGTKELSRLLKLPKTYKAEILLGVQTDTGDITGTIVKSEKVHKVASEDIGRVLQEMVGKLELPVPAYSAIKQGGEPLYKKARRGERVDAPVRRMFVTTVTNSLIVRNAEDIKVRATFEVESGTYIRSLAEELGRRLGVPATLSALRRTKIGEYDVKNATTV